MQNLKKVTDCISDESVTFFIGVNAVQTQVLAEIFLEKEGGGDIHHRDFQCHAQLEDLKVVHLVPVGYGVRVPSEPFQDIGSAFRSHPFSDMLEIPVRVEGSEGKHDRV